MAHTKKLKEELDKIFAEQRDLAVHYLSLVLKHPDSKSEKIIIRHDEGVFGSPYFVLDLNWGLLEKMERELDAYSGLSIGLQFSGVFSLFVQDERLELKYNFSEQEAEKLIPLKIRNAMQNFQKKYNDMFKEKYYI